MDARNEMAEDLKVCWLGEVLMPSIKIAMKKFQEPESGLPCFYVTKDRYFPWSFIVIF
jgi:hypothetical protein